MNLSSTNTRYYAITFDQRLTTTPLKIQIAFNKFLPEVYFDQLIDNPIPELTALTKHVNFTKFFNYIGPEILAFHNLILRDHDGQSALMKTIQVLAFFVAEIRTEKENNNVF